MSHDLTPFQLWSLFKMYEQHHKIFNLRTLLLDCCDSAILTLRPQTIGNEIDNLIQRRLIMSGSSRGSLLISDAGILFVRQNIAGIQNRCNQGNIPKSIIMKQDHKLKKALVDKVPNLSDVVIRAGINNIGPLMELLNIL